MFLLSPPTIQPNFVSSHRVYEHHRTRMPFLSHWHSRGYFKTSSPENVFSHCSPYHVKAYSEQVRGILVDIDCTTTVVHCTSLLNMTTVVLILAQLPYSRSLSTVDFTTWKSIRAINFNQRQSVWRTNFVLD